MLFTPVASLLLTDDSWLALAAFLDPKHPLHGRHQVRIFTSRRRAQELRHAWPMWQELGMGIVPL